jgi:Na+-driven multidrug efflux pump
MKNKNQLAEGSLVRNLFTIAWPIIMANVLQTAYQLIDTFWLGRLGANAVAAVSISFPILFLVLSLGSGLTLAGTVIVSQFKGSDDPKMIDFTASQTVFIVFLISILLALLGYVSAAPLMNLIGAGPEILNDSVTYFQVSSFGFVFLFMFFVFQSVMRGIGNVLLPMYIVFGTVLLGTAVLKAMGWQVLQ